MPQRINIVGDLGTTKIASDSYDIDNIYLSEEGWVYRHYKRADKSKWWDEIIVAGEVVAVDNMPCIETNPKKLGDPSVPVPLEIQGADAGDDDDLNDFEYSPIYGNDIALGGGSPFGALDNAGDAPTPPDTGGDDGSVSDTGEITYNTLSQGGLNYTTGAANLLGGTGTGATINIDTVDADGQILTYTLTDGGQNYGLDTLTVDGGDGNAKIFVTQVYSG